MSILDHNLIAAGYHHPVYINIQTVINFDTIAKMSFDNAPKLMNCIKHLLNSEMESDIQFHFANSSVKLHGHKFIIGLRSSVFHTMFYGRLSMAAEKPNVCKIVDISSESFLEMLRFIYVDEVNICEQNFSEIMYAAHKYSINHLEKMCCSYAAEKLNPDNCCSYLRQCFLYNNDLSKKCMDVIDKDIRLIIDKNTWKDLNEDQISAVLRRDTLDTDEYNLFQGVLAWAENYSLKKGIDVNVFNIREKFKIFELVRFPIMSMAEFCRFHRHNKYFLRTEEISAIFQYINAGIVSASLKHSTIQRKYKSTSSATLNVREYGKGSRKSQRRDRVASYS